MQFSIEILSLSRETKPTAKGGSYVQLDVAFKNLTSGKVEGKKVMSFVKPEKVFKTLNEAVAGNQFTITSEKKEGDQYWQWTDAVAIAPGASPSKGVDVVRATTVAPRSTYETHEERAAKQVAIAKQSSLDRAVQLLAIGAKSPPSVQSVIDTAQKFTDWVLSSPSVPDSGVPLLDMQDDIPL
jgi:hypothetical protein